MIKQVDFAFRTLDSDGEETYQNTGISMKGSPDADWDQFLYDRGSSKGQVVDELESKLLDLHLLLLEVVIGEGDDGLYVHVFPYTEEGGWDFEACKA